MAEPITAPRGTYDLLPGKSYKWHYIEKILTSICESFGYSEIRTPTFEYTEVFSRGLGESTDIVGKEMYTMTDKGGRSITLRPEGTANTMRALIQHGLLKGLLPVRVYYISSCFRYEKPQSGRYREHHQIGVELMGSQYPDADSEIIKLAYHALQELGIKNTRLEINSLGCRECRSDYIKSLKNYFEQNIHLMCPTCNERLERNPLRILDCKSDICKEISSKSPDILSFICEPCAEHFSELNRQLNDAGIDFIINSRIVRGQDYYSRTVFEFVHEGAGAQGTVCGGGRYDRLVEYLGSDPCPGIGFGMGLERILLVMEAEGIKIPIPEGPEVFIAHIGEISRKTAADLVFELQKSGVYALYDINRRGLKAQLKFADKVSSKRYLVIGESELVSGMATIKDMKTKEETTIDLNARSIIAIL